MSPPPSGLKGKPSKKLAGSKQSIWLAKMWDSIEVEGTLEANPSVPIGKPCALLAACLKLVSCLVYSSTLKMETTCSSEMLVDFQQST
jgi:hypothetical protein